jgi:hypothetical protein
MALRDRAELAAGAGLLLVCAAFIASFGMGLRRGAEPPLQDAAAPALRVPETAAGRVEVLNASGRGGLARAATAQLRDAGFDVVYFGNAAGAAGDSSVVIARVESQDVARAAARHLRIGQVRSDPDASMFLDATVVIGGDWPPQAVSAPPPPESWRARIGRWLRPGS